MRLKKRLLPFSLRLHACIRKTRIMHKIRCMQMNNKKEFAEMQNETQKEIAGIQSANSRQNTKDQVYAKNEMLDYQQKESTAHVASIIENFIFLKKKQVPEIIPQFPTQPLTA